MHSIMWYADGSVVLFWSFPCSKICESNVNLPWVIECLSVGLIDSLFVDCLQPIFTVSSQDQLISLLTVEQMHAIKEIYKGNPVRHCCCVSVRSAAYCLASFYCWYALEWIGVTEREEKATTILWSSVVVNCHGMLHLLVIEKSGNVGNFVFTSEWELYSSADVKKGIWLQWRLSEVREESDDVWTFAESVGVSQCIRQRGCSSGASVWLVGVHLGDQ